MRNSEFSPVRRGQRGAQCARVSTSSPSAHAVRTAARKKQSSAAISLLSSLKSSDASQDFVNAVLSCRGKQASPVKLLGNNGRGYSLSSPVLSRDCSSSSSLSDLGTAMTGSPKSERLVEICRNCRFSFRVTSKNSSEFCSKDCATCYTVFYKAAAPVNSAERSAEQIRRDIFLFQMRDTDDNGMVAVPFPLDVAPHPTDASPTARKRIRF
eukprot:gene26962-32576_t